MSIQFREGSNILPQQYRHTRPLRYYSFVFDYVEEENSWYTAKIEHRARFISKLPLLVEIYGEYGFMKSKNFARYAWFVLGYNTIVILWGAFVRATGSGAGCGSHWPLCNGEIIPRSPQLETIIEFAHRITSGLSLLLAVVLFLWAFRIFEKKHRVRLGASLILLFLVTEALVGAGLVLAEWVATDASQARVIVMGVHLINTFLLLAANVFTAWWASGGENIILKGHGIILWLFIAGFVGIIFIGVTGAITALGDTLFPSGSLAEGIQQDFSLTAHFLIRLRLWHPLIALSVGIYTLFLSCLVAMFRVTPIIRRFTALLASLFVAQLLAGLINLVLLAPVWMQIVHLLLADAVWISFVLLAATNFSMSEIRQNEYSS